MTLSSSTILLCFASLVTGQYGPGGRHGPDADGGDGGNTFNSSPGNTYSNGRFNFDGYFGGNKILIAHGVLASLAFVVLFPTGSIMIRLASFRGLWLIHGLFQIFASVVYVAAFALGVWMTQQAPARAGLVGRYHPIVGIVLFVVLFIQPVLGWMHHFQFKKLGLRTPWSYAHLWLGRLLITLGIINGGLGLLLATQTGYGRPTTGQIVAYGVVSAVMWLLWVAASMFGERRRAAACRAPKGVYKKNQSA